jgi:hypothetical protein
MDSVNQKDAENIEKRRTWARKKIQLNIIKDIVIWDIKYKVHIHIIYKKPNLAPMS